MSGIKLPVPKRTLYIVIILVVVAGGYIVYSSYPFDGNEIMNVEGEVDLPEPYEEGEISVEEAIEQRRSVRSYTDEPLELEEVSQLLWAAQGITDEEEGYRAAPSAGATYPLEVYLVVSEDEVEGLDKGVYLYDPDVHKLENVTEGDVSYSLQDAALDQDWVGDAPVNLVISGVYDRTTGVYGERGERYVEMEAGHAGQNIYLQAESLGLGTVVVGAFEDDEVQEVLGIPGDHEPLYVIPVGHPAE